MLVVWNYWYGQHFKQILLFLNFIVDQLFFSLNSDHQKKTKTEAGSVSLNIFMENIVLKDAIMDNFRFIISYHFSHANHLRK